MAEETWKFLIAEFLVPIGLVALGGFLTYFSAFRSQRKEWWWQRKAEAYSNVIEALHEAKMFSETHFDAVTTNREVQEARSNELRDRWRVATDTIAKVRDTGMFYLSEEVVERLKQYEKEQQSARQHTNWFDHLDSDLAATSSCLKDIIGLANKDLGRPN